MELQISRLIELLEDLYPYLLVLHCAVYNLWGSSVFTDESLGILLYTLVTELNIIHTFFHGPVRSGSTATCRSLLLHLRRIELLVLILGRFHL
jgi:hypothetical protein